MTRKAVYNPEADKRWNEKNKEHRNYLSQRSAAKSFIRNRAKLDDLENLEEMIKEKREQLLSEEDGI